MPGAGWFTNGFDWNVAPHSRYVLQIFITHVQWHIYIIYVYFSYIYIIIHMLCYMEIYIYIYVCMYMYIYIYVHTHLFTYILSGSYHNIHSTLEWRHTKPFPHMLEKPTHTHKFFMKQHHLRRGPTTSSFWGRHAYMTTHIYYIHIRTHTHI